MFPFHCCLNSRVFIHYQIEHTLTWHGIQWEAFFIEAVWNCIKALVSRHRLRAYRGRHLGISTLIEVFIFSPLPTHQKHTIFKQFTHLCESRCVLRDHRKGKDVTCSCLTISFSVYTHTQKNIEGIFTFPTLHIKWAISACTSNAPKGLGLKGRSENMETMKRQQLQWHILPVELILLQKRATLYSSQAPMHQITNVIL